VHFLAALGAVSLLPFLGAALPLESPGMIAYALRGPDSGAVGLDVIDPNTFQPVMASPLQFRLLRTPRSLYSIIETRQDGGGTDRRGQPLPSSFHFPYVFRTA
jgi:hypothetical protein